jgi:hypothetical protein
MKEKAEKKAAEEKAEMVLPYRHCSMFFEIGAVGRIPEAVTLISLQKITVLLHNFSDTAMRDKTG